MVWTQGYQLFVSHDHLGEGSLWKTTNNNWQSWYTCKLRTRTSELMSTSTCTLQMTSNETDKQTIDGSKITAKQQPTNKYNFQVLATNHITTKSDQSKPRQRHKYHHLTMTLHLTLKMTTAQVVETSVTNNSLSKDYPHKDDHAKLQITTVLW